MSKKFYAVNRETGKKWEPKTGMEKEFLVMYDSGYLGVVRDDGYLQYVTPLDIRLWKTVIKLEDNK